MLAFTAVNQEPITPPVSPPETGGERTLPTRFSEEPFNAYTYNKAQNSSLIPLKRYPHSQREDRVLQVRFDTLPFLVGEPDWFFEDVRETYAESDIA